MIEHAIKENGERSNKSMITLMRIDNRLIHGQVALLWTKYLNVNRIVVANDKIAENDIQKAALKMACPATAKCSVLNVNDAVAVLNDPRAEQLRILVIVNNPTDARRLVEAVPSIPLINISNYGALGDDGGNRTKITETVLASDTDFDEFARIEKTGIRCQYQVTPTDKPQSIYELIDKIKKGE